MQQRLLMAVGKYSGYSKLSPNETRRTVFVCKGNICRSALAEYYLKQKGLTTASFGLHCNDGAPANATMIKVAGEQGISLRDHRTTSVESFEVTKGDLLVAMEPSQITHLKNIIGESDDIQFVLLGMFLTRRQPTIVDPYGREERLFEEVAALIFQGIDNLHSALG